MTEERVVYVGLIAICAPAAVRAVSGSNALGTIDTLALIAFVVGLAAFVRSFCSHGQLPAARVRR